MLARYFFIAVLSKSICPSQLGCSKLAFKMDTKVPCVVVVEYRDEALLDVVNIGLLCLS